MGTKTINNIVIENVHTLLTAKPKWINTLNLKVNVNVTKSFFFRNCRKTEIFSYFELISG